MVAEVTGEACQGSEGNGKKQGLSGVIVIVMKVITSRFALFPYMWLDLARFGWPFRITLHSVV